MSKPVNIETIEEMARLFESTRLAFPHLAMQLDRRHPELDLNMDIPAQPGLLFDINVNLQGDELHLCAGAFLWLECFPCTDPDVVARFREALHGLLSGTFRIVETLRGSQVVKAQLQRPANRGWKRFGTSHSFHIPIGPKSTRVLQNVRPGDGS